MYILIVNNAIYDKMIYFTKKHVKSLYSPYIIHSKIQECLYKCKKLGIFTKIFIILEFHSIALKKNN
jgi:hypothetical protein